MTTQVKKQGRLVVLIGFFGLMMRIILYRGKKIHHCPLKLGGQIDDTYHTTNNIISNALFRVADWRRTNQCVSPITSFSWIQCRVDWTIIYIFKFVALLQYHNCFHVDFLVNIAKPRKFNSLANSFWWGIGNIKNVVFACTLEWEVGLVSI